MQGRIRDAVAAQEPSTERGAVAKRLTLKLIDIGILMNVYEMRGDRAAIDGKRAVAERWYGRADRAAKRYRRQWKQTKRAWARAGFRYG